MNWKYEDGRIYSTDEQDELLSEATYIQNQPEEIIINHVYVNPSLRGQGVADQTMLVVIDYLRKKNLKAAATCPYASAWLQRNKEKCADILIK